MNPIRPSACLPVQNCKPKSVDARGVFLRPGVRCACREHCLTSAARRSVWSVSSPSSVQVRAPVHSSLARCHHSRRAVLFASTFFLPARALYRFHLISKRRLFALSPNQINTGRERKLCHVVNDPRPAGHCFGATGRSNFNPFHDRFRNVRRVWRLPSIKRSPLGGYVIPVSD